MGAVRAEEVGWVVVMRGMTAGDAAAAAAAVVEAVAAMAAAATAL